MEELNNNGTIEDDSDQNVTALAVNKEVKEMEKEMDNKAEE